MCVQTAVLSQLRQLHNLRQLDVQNDNDHDDFGRNVKKYVSACAVVDVQSRVVILSGRVVTPVPIFRFCPFNGLHRYILRWAGLE